MQGRLEHTLQTENSIRRLLENAPEIIKEYSFNFDAKTAKTKEVYIRYIIDFVLFFNGKDPIELKSVDINRYMESIKYRKVGDKIVENKPSIRRARLAAIKNFYDFLENNGMIDSSPARKVNPPKLEEELDVVAMDVNEIKIMKENILNGVGSHRAKAYQKDWVNRDLAIVALGCSTGLRCTAITEIDISDIDFDSGTIKVIEKGNSVRKVLIGDKTKEILLMWIVDRSRISGVDTDALFISSQKKRISRRAVFDLIKKYSVNIDKHITPHKMRSSCATNLYEQTGDIYLVQQVLGHKNIANTMRYTRISDEKKKEAAKILNDLF